MGQSVFLARWHRPGARRTALFFQLIVGLVVCATIRPAEADTRVTAGAFCMYLSKTVWPDRPNTVDALAGPDGLVGGLTAELRGSASSGLIGGVRATFSTPLASVGSENLPAFVEVLVGWRVINTAVKLDVHMGTSLGGPYFRIDAGLWNSGVDLFFDVSETLSIAVFGEFGQFVDTYLGVLSVGITWTLDKRQ